MNPVYGTGFASDDFEAMNDDSVFDVTEKPKEARRRSVSSEDAFPKVWDRETVTDRHTIEFLDQDRDAVMPIVGSGALDASYMPFLGGGAVAPVQADPTVAVRFRDLAAQWERETMFTSSPHETILHEAYQQIIGLGDKVLPCLLERLPRNPQRWLWALRAVAQADPAAGATSLEDAVAAWRAWAKDKNLVVP